VTHRGAGRGGRGRVSTCVIAMGSALLCRVPGPRLQEAHCKGQTPPQAQQQQQRWRQRRHEEAQWQGSAHRFVLLPADGSCVSRFRKSRDGSRAGHGAPARAVVSRRPKLVAACCQGSHRSLSGAAARVLLSGDCSATAAGSAHRCLGAPRMRRAPRCRRSTWACQLLGTPSPTKAGVGV
jgi:hypothetical protein